MSDESRLGVLLPHWVPPARPTGEVLQGRSVRLEHMEADHHAADLHRAYQGHDGLDYMPYGPFSFVAAYHRWCKESDDGGPDVLRSARHGDGAMRRRGVLSGASPPRRGRSRSAISALRPKSRNRWSGPRRCF